MAKQLVKILDNGVSLSLEGEANRSLYRLEVDGQQYLIHHLGELNFSRTDPNFGNVRVKVAYKMVELDQTHGIYGTASVINDSIILEKLSLEYHRELTSIDPPQHLKHEILLGLDTKLQSQPKPNNNT